MNNQEIVNIIPALSTAIDALNRAGNDKDALVLTKKLKDVVNLIETDKVIK